MDYSVQYCQSLGFSWPCPLHGFEVDANRLTKPVVETNEWRFRHVNDIDSSLVLVFPRLRCVPCAARQRQIDAELKKAQLHANLRDDLQLERKTLTPRFSAIDERVLALVRQRFPAVDADFPFVLSHKSAITKSLQLLLVSANEAVTSNGLERILDRMRCVGHSLDTIKYVEVCARSYYNSKQLHDKRCAALRKKRMQQPLLGGRPTQVLPALPPPVLSDPPQRPRGKFSDNAISTCIAQFAATVQVMFYNITVVGLRRVDSL
jgi:hypothetical protein